MKYIFLIIMIVFSMTASAFAAPSYTSARSEARSLSRAENRFARTVARLSPADRERLKAALSAYTDSDKDGSSDIFEAARGSSLCDNDSDSDGVEDGDDRYEDSRDGDRDGHEDGYEVEAKGRVISFEGRVLIVGSKTFIVTDTTRFRGVNLSEATLTAGTCVEVEGHLSGADTIADKIESERSCR